MEVIIASAVFAVAILLMPALVRWTKRTSGPHSGSGIGAVGTVFNEAFDPAAAKSQEAREAQELVGKEAEGRDEEKLSPPQDKLRQG